MLNRGVSLVYLGKMMMTKRCTSCLTQEAVQEENSHHEISPGVVAARRHVLCAPFRFNRIVDVWCGFREGNQNGGR